MAIVTQYHKDTDTTYVYESESYYDPSKKQSRSKRKLIGKLDKETGEIVPTGRRGPKKKESPETEAASEGLKRTENSRQMEEKIQELEGKVSILRNRIERLEEENRELRIVKEEAVQLRRENQKLAAILEKIRSLTA